MLGGSVGMSSQGSSQAGSSKAVAGSRAGDGASGRGVLGLRPLRLASFLALPACACRQLPRGEDA